MTIMSNIQTRLLKVERETFDATRITSTVRMCLSWVITIVINLNARSTGL